FLAHRTSQRANHFLRVMQMVILFVSLISRLRPPTNLCMLRLDVFNSLSLECATSGEDKDLRAIRVRQHDRIAAIVINETRKRIEMWPIVNKDTVALERRRELSNFKIILLSRTGEDRNPLSFGRYAIFQVTYDSHKIFIEARSRGRVQIIRPPALSQLLANERQKIV